MKQFKFMILSGIFVCMATILFAQEEGWTTYYAENVEFKIDFPDDWIVGFAEEKTLGFYNAAATASSGVGNYGYIVVLLSGAYKPVVVKGFAAPINDDMKWYTKRNEKDAKKSGDPEYKELESGVEDFHVEKTTYGWQENIHTHVSETGEKIVIREREVFIYFISTPRYRIKINFSSKVEEWDEAVKVFDKIIESFDRYQP